MIDMSVVIGIGTTRELYYTEQYENRKLSSDKKLTGDEDSNNDHNLNDRHMIID
jgi:hypothetical protein